MGRGLVDIGLDAVEFEPVARQELDGAIHPTTGHPNEPTNARPRRLQPLRQSFPSPEAFLTALTRRIHVPAARLWHASPLCLVVEATQRPPVSDCPAMTGRAAPGSSARRARHMCRWHPGHKKSSHVSVLSGPAASTAGRGWLPCARPARHSHGRARASPLGTGRLGLGRGGSWAVGVRRRCCSVMRVARRDEEGSGRSPWRAAGSLACCTAGGWLGTVRQARGGRRKGLGKGLWPLSERVRRRPQGRSSDLGPNHFGVCRVCGRLVGPSAGLGWTYGLCGPLGERMGATSSRKRSLEYPTCGKKRSIYFWRLISGGHFSHV